MAWTFIAIADNTNLCDPKEYFKCFPFLYMYCFVHLPFSDIISGPPESPWQESLPLSPAQMWKLRIFFILLAIKYCLKSNGYIITIQILLFNFSWVIIFALFIGDHCYIHLLEYWGWYAIRGGCTPSSHCSHLACVQ